LKLGSTNGYPNSHSNGFANGNTNGFGNGHFNESNNGNLNGAANGNSNGSTNEFQNLMLKGGPARLFVLSSFDEITGRRQVENLQQYLEERQDTSDPEFIDNLAYTLNERRTHHIWRAAIVARSTKDLAQSINSGVPFSSSGTKKRKLGFVFTGQGAQWCGMGKELISAYPVFRASLEKIAICLKDAGASFDAIGTHFSSTTVILFMLTLAY
jgi:acyl transferase domain-containing protein